MEPNALELRPLEAPQRGFLLIGELDMASVSDLKLALASLAGEGQVTLDLSQLTFVDSTGLHAIMAYARSENGNGPLILANPPAMFQRVLEIVGFDNHPALEIEPKHRGE